MSVKHFDVQLTAPHLLSTFVQKWHYSGGFNGVTVTHSFGLYDNDKLIGAMIYGSLGMANAYKKFADKPEKVIELRRLCCIDDTPKNTESYFIGKTLRWLKTNTNIQRVVSYADQHHGHIGTIYRASNFNYWGTTSPTKVIVWGSNEYHDKTIRTYYRDKYGQKRLKPFAYRIREAIQRGEATYETRPPKHLYVYELNGKKISTGTGQLEMDFN